MMPQKPTKRTYSAVAEIDFPKIEQFLTPILTSIATHDMNVVPEAQGYKVSSPFGNARLFVEDGRLKLAVETETSQALNRLKHALVGPISFIAASERLKIEWVGDETGYTSLEDLRILRVISVRYLTPKMLRIVFTGEGLEHFDRNDQIHCRLIFQPKDVVSAEWPVLDDRGHIIWPRQRKLTTRVYTIRAIDSVRGEITIDFALHCNAGPATQWAIDASEGDMVGIVGPAADGFKRARFYVLMGDETGLPGIARILETLDEHATGIGFIEIEGPSGIQTLKKPSGFEVNWLFRGEAAAGTTTLLPKVLASVNWPADLDEVFFWGGCEHSAFRAIHQYLRYELKLPRANQVLYSHWHRSLNEEQIVEIGGEAYLPE